MVVMMLISEACGNDDTHGAIMIIAVMTLRMVIWLLSKHCEICTNLQGNKTQTSNDYMAFEHCANLLATADCCDSVLCNVFSTNYSKKKKPLNLYK